MDNETTRIIESVIADKGVLVRFYGKDNLYANFESGEQESQWSAQRLKDVYDALQVIERNFASP